MTAPVLQALLVADHVYQDQSTGKFVICGIFGTIFFIPNEAGAPTPPETHPPQGGGATREFEQQATNVDSPNPKSLPLNRVIRAGSPYAYLSLTEIHGLRSFELRYVDLNENTVHFGLEFNVDCRNPLETVQLSIPLPVLPVPREGVFVLELLCEGEMLGSHRILTKQQPHP